MMDELNFFPFYYDLFSTSQDKEISSYIKSEDAEPSSTEWQQEYELINISHQLEYGW